MVRYKEDKAPVSIFTPESIASLLKKADATLRPYLALGAFAGLRTAELQRMDWSEIDLDRGFITVAASKAKTRRRRLVPISDNLKLWLTPIWQPGRTEYTKSLIPIHCIVSLNCVSQAKTV
jgi:integrase